MIVLKHKANHIIPLSKVPLPLGLNSNFTACQGRDYLTPAYLISLLLVKSLLIQDLCSSHAKFLAVVFTRQVNVSRCTCGSLMLLASTLHLHNTQDWTQPLLWLTSATHFSPPCEQQHVRSYAVPQLECPYQFSSSFPACFNRQWRFRGYFNR